MTAPDDLRARLEAAARWLEACGWPGNEYAATLREVLAHPERLMVPVWFAQYVHGILHEASQVGDHSDEVALYAAKPAGEVKP